MVAGLFLAGAAAAADHSCSSCQEAKQSPYNSQFCTGCKNKYQSPYVHPGTTFGYYPSCWHLWPGGATCPRPGCGAIAAPPAVDAPPAIQVVPPVIDTPPKPKTPDAEPLAPPRPAINPAVYRK
jgi:hypothetical protein